MGIRGLFRLSNQIVVTVLLGTAIFVLLYRTACTPIDTLDLIDANARVLLVGRVRSAPDPSNDPQVAYLLEDPTGHVWCVTAQGAPATGALLLVWARTDRDQRSHPLCVEERRFGTF